MSDQDNNNQQMAAASESYTSASMNNATLNYALYLLGIVIPFVPIVGVIFAYMNRGKGGADVDSHYTFQIRTFWIAILGSIVGVLLSVILIGFVVILAVFVWMVIRCIKGISASTNKKPIPDPQTWLF